MNSDALRMYRAAYSDAVRRGLTPEQADTEARLRVQQHAQDMLRLANARLSDSWEED